MHHPNSQCTFPRGTRCPRCDDLLSELVKTRSTRDLKWDTTSRTYIFSRQLPGDVSKDEIRRITRKAYSALMSIYLDSKDPVRVNYAYHSGMKYTRVHLMVDIPSLGEVSEGAWEEVFEAFGERFKDWVVAEVGEHTLLRRLQFFQGQVDLRFRLSMA
ncbi:hypothetical protein BJX70DRAFT_395330 [Aspergillus crustosus]